MSSSLGEKLRQAREERGITISEVAEQTRISALYLGCIEADDYRTLPGGIFNKGFIKSFAKYVGVDEQEALQDYARLVANQDNEIVDEPKTYRPQVLTDDNSAVSKLPTIIIAGVILAAMTFGVLMLVRYIQQTPTTTTEANANVNTNANASSNIVLANTNTSTATSNVPAMSDLKVEFKAVNAPVSLTATVDGKTSSVLVTTDDIELFEPKQSLRLRYAKARAQNAALLINGKQIALPTAASTARNIIEVEINSENLGRIWESGQTTTTSAPR